MSADPTRVAVSVDPSIGKHRTADATVTLTVDGAPLAGREVVLAQRNHQFRFGCIGFDLVGLANGEALPQASLPVAAVDAPAETDAPGAVGTQSREQLEALAGHWFELFNFAVLPFYWSLFEPEAGRRDTERLRTAARWFVDRGCPVKGHPLVWHTLAPQWLTQMSSRDVARTVVERIRREMTDFAGLVDEWDVINEVVIMPVFDKYDNAITRLCRERGRIPMVRTVFEAAREANPRATLLLNDFDFSTAYECLIEGVLEAGVEIDVLGIQSHMHQGYWGEEKTLAILDRFARYGLPIHFTETTIVSGHLMPPEIDDLNDYQIPAWPTTPEGEQRQADEIVRHYRTLLSHPSVQASTYWGIQDGGWLGAPGGFVRADGTPKPSYEALHSLVKGEWWLPETTMVTDEDGRLRLCGFLGEYEVSAAGTTATFRLDKPGEAAIDIAL